MILNRGNGVKLVGSSFIFLAIFGLNVEKIFTGK
jgi:hypothetical protein